jgi:hypothetical protein
MTNAIAAYKAARAAYFAQMDGAEAKSAYEAHAKASDEFHAGRISVEKYFAIRAAHETQNAKFDALSVALNDAKDRAEAEGAVFCEWTGDLVEAEADAEQTLELFA